MKTRMFDRLGKTVAVGSIGVGMLAGCSQEIPERNTPDSQVTTDIGGEHHSIIDHTPEGMSVLTWCGYEAARVAISEILTNEKTADLGDGFFKNEHGSASVQETSIGYVYSVDTIIDAKNKIAVRGEWSIQSTENTPVDALNPTAFDKSGLRVNPDAPIAVWNLDEDTGGTTNDMESEAVCALAQEVVDAFEK